jgi:hypothetical protein
MIEGVHANRLQNIIKYTEQEYKFYIGIKVRVLCLPHEMRCYVKKINSVALFRKLTIPWSQFLATDPEVPGSIPGDASCS